MMTSGARWGQSGLQKVQLAARHSEAKRR